MLTAKLTGDISEDRLDQISRDLVRDLNRAGVDARLPEEVTRPGDRGGLAAVGQFLLDLLGVSAIARALGVLEAYVSAIKGLLSNSNYPTAGTSRSTRRTLGCARFASC